MVHFPGHQPPHQAPELARQDVRLAVHGANDVACLQIESGELEGMQHLNSLLQYYTVKCLQGWLLS